jgi:glutamine synthetase
MSKILADYVWIGGNMELRSKVMVLTLKNSKHSNGASLEDFPEWNYDGSSTAQASGSDSEVIIKPHSIYKCPFRKGDNVIVFCDTYLPNGEPHQTNHRYDAKRIFDRKPELEPWYGLEQEYFLMDRKTNKPYGSYEEPIVQGQYYCSIGSRNAFGRKIVDDHLDACLYAGLKISGINAEVAPGQWEFQIGPSVGIEAGDHLWMARYLLERITENGEGVYIDYHPKPLQGINGSGCHCNYSTNEMRDGREAQDGKKGIEFIYEAIKKLEEKHDEHMMVYGADNDKRMTGLHETSSYKRFTYGKANRGCSVRIGNKTVEEGRGYFEDRRPASNCDPYLVTSIIFETTT